MRISLCPDERSGGGVFAVLDGHGGSSAAFDGARLLEEALKQVTLCGKPPGQVQKKSCKTRSLTLIAACAATLKQEDRSGSTVVACILTPECVWFLTPCRSHMPGILEQFLSRKRCLFFSKDHKPNREDETRRIEAAGGCVSQGPLGGPMRVDGALAVSRALGDFHFKPQGDGTLQNEGLGRAPKCKPSLGAQQGIGYF